MSTAPEAPRPAAINWADVRARVDRANHPVQQDPGAILRRRAELLARRPERLAEAANAEARQMLAFVLGGQTYGLDAANVREVVPASTLRPLPGLPASFRGLANVRSQIVPAFDVRILLQLRPSGKADRTEILVVLNHEAAEFGLVVDEIVGVVLLRPEAVRTDVVGLQSQYLTGVADDGLLLLDIAALAAALRVEDRPS